MDATETRMTERLVLGAILWAPLRNEKVGPLCLKALDYAPQFWQEPLYGKVAKAVRMAIRHSGTADQVSTYRYLSRTDDAVNGDEFRALCQLCSSEQDAPMSMAEHHAKDLVALYAGLAIVNRIGEAWEMAKNNPNKAHIILQSLKK